MKSDPLVNLLIIGVIVLALAYPTYKSAQRWFVRSNANGFRGYNVYVDYAAGTIKIGRRTYSVADIRTIDWHRPEQSRGGNLVKEYVRITLNDIDHPLHKIRTQDRGSAEQFAKRLVLAIEKAGGPSFTI